MELLTAEMDPDHIPTVFDGVLKSLRTLLIHGCRDDSVSVQTLKYRLVNRIMASMDMSFEDISELLASNIPIHPEVSEVMKNLCEKHEYAEPVLAQDFVDTEKVIKLLRHIYKNDARDAHYLLAMDGLNGSKLSKGPNTSIKLYLDNLRFGSTPGVYARGNSTRQGHVYAIRKVYDELGEELADCKGVYQVMCQTLKEMAGIDLPIIDTPEIPPEIMETCVNIYKTHVNPAAFEALTESLKTRIVDDDQEGSKRRGKKFNSAEPKDKFRPVIKPFSMSSSSPDAGLPGCVHQ